MIKYLLTIPFRPTTTFKKWHKSYKVDDKLKENTMLLFVAVSFLIIGSEIFYHSISIKKDLNYNHILFSYIEIMVASVLLYFSMQLYATRGEDDLSRLKWLQVYLLATGFWLFINNMFYALLRDIDLRVYMFMAFFFQIIMAIYLMKGMTVCKETTLSKAKTSTKIGVVLRYTCMLVVSKFLGAIISGRYYL
jgi:hypothetical protein